MNGANRIGVIHLPPDPVQNPEGVRVIAVRDFSGNGNVDLLWQDAWAKSHYLWTLTESGLSFTDGVAAGEHGLFAHDVDGDGDPDVVLEPPAMWFMNGVTFASGRYLPAVSDQDMRMRGAARIGSNPRAALPWRNRFTGQNAFWYVNTDGTITGVYMPSVADPDWTIGGTF